MKDKVLSMEQWSALLPHKIKFKTKRGYDTLETVSDWQINCDCEDTYDYSEIKPFLYDLSWLNTVIVTDGKKFSFNSYLKKYFPMYQLLDNGIFDNNYGKFVTFERLPYGLVNTLLSHRFNILNFPKEMIETITKENNPYK